MSPQAKRVHRAQTTLALQAVARAERPNLVSITTDLAPAATALTLVPSLCSWPIGDPALEGFGFCGRERQRGSYCAEHDRVAHKPVPADLKTWDGKGNPPLWARS